MEKQIKILRDFEQQTWITKEKKEVKIKDLELSHLKNIVKYLKKQFDSLEDPLNDYPSLSGEMAQYYAEYEWSANAQQYNALKRKLDLFECYYKIKNL